MWSAHSGAINLWWLINVECSSLIFIVHSKTDGSRWTFNHRLLCLAFSLFRGAHQKLKVRTLRQKTNWNSGIQSTNMSQGTGPIQSVPAFISQYLPIPTAYPSQRQRAWLFVPKEHEADRWESFTETKEIRLNSLWRLFFLQPAVVSSDSNSAQTHACESGNQHLVTVLMC
jgi:hypothetical protein